MHKKRALVGGFSILIGAGLILFSLLPLYGESGALINDWNVAGNTAAKETAGMTAGVVLIIIGAIFMIAARSRTSEHAVKRREEVQRAYAELERIQSDTPKK